MSGGYFEYQQFRIEEIAEALEELIGRTINPNLDEEETFRVPPEVLTQLGWAVLELRRAYIHAQRADWYICGDDGEESYLRRLREELYQAHERHEQMFPEGWADLPEQVRWEGWVIATKDRQQ